MPRKSKSGIGSTNPVPFGMSNRVMKRKKPINLDYIKKIEPLTENQETFFESYAEDKNLVAYGVSWYRKDLYYPLQRPMDVLDTKTPYEKIYIVRSLVPTREIGFLPGDHEDKSDIYQIPYKNMVKYMFEMLDDNSFEMSMQISKLRVQLVSGVHLLLEVQLLIMLSSSLTSFRI